MACYSIILRSSSKRLPNSAQQQVRPWFEIVNFKMLGYVDYIVLAVTLFISSAIGVYYHRNDNSKDYLLAGRSANPLTVAFSLMASFMSAITLLGVTFENYMYGTQFILINLAYAIGTPIAAHVYLPVFFNLESPSAYAYLEKRFGLATRLVASLSFSLQMILYMGKC